MSQCRDAAEGQGLYHRGPRACSHHQNGPVLMSPRGSLERRAAFTHGPPCWLGAEHRGTGSSPAWLVRTDTGCPGTCKLHSLPWHHFLCCLCHVLRCAKVRHGVRLSLSLPFVQAHCWVVCASPCPNSVSHQVALAVGKKTCKERYFVQPVKGKGDSSLAMKFFSFQKFPASVFFCSLSPSQPVGALRNAALPWDSAAL